MAVAAGGLVAMTVAARADAGVGLGDLLGSTTGWLLWQAAMLAAAGAAVGWLLARPAADPGRRRPGCWCTRWPGTRPAVVAAPLNLLAQWTHLLAVGVWIGGLAWLFAGLGGHATARPTREVVLRFSKLAGISLAVVVVTGVVRTADELGGWGRLVDSRFGRALDLKLLLFAGLVGLGALNRYRLVPLFQAGARRRAATRLRRSVGAELGLAAAVPAAALLSQWPRAPGPGPGRRRRPRRSWRPVVPTGPPPSGSP